MTADRDRRDAAVGGWLAQHGGGPALALCADAPQPATEGRLAVRFDTCLGQVAPHRLVDLALAAGHPLLLTGPCAPGCPAPASLHPLCALVGPGVLAAATAGDGVPGPTLDVTRPPVSRRGLLERFVPADRAEHPASDDAGRLVESLRRAGVADGSVHSPARALVVAGCTACGLCVRTCPHEALALESGQGRSRLAHHPDRCRGEQTCVAVCPVDAITADEPLPWTDALSGVRTLAVVSSGPCQRCGATTTAPGGLCEHCAWRRANPFGSVVPGWLRGQDGASDDQGGRSR